MVLKPQAEKLRKCGVEKIACAAVTSPERLEEWSKKAGNDGQVRFSWPPITCACLCRFTSSELSH